MKILSAQIRNYRVHRETTVDFNGPLLLLHGPNESGKSTLAEAMHCALFLKAKGTTELHERMQSTFGGDPEIRILFEAAGRRHTLTKIFGNKGTTTLESEGQATLNGDAAEEQLAHLLGVECAIGGRGAAGALPKRWAHLWVWQGKSSGSPIDSLEECERPLREKLQARAGQSIISSPTDAAVIDQLQALVNATLTSTGRPKAGSDLLKAEEALDQARRALEVKEATLEGLRRAAENYEQARSDENRYTQSLTDSGIRLKAIREKLENVRDHRERLKEKTRDRESIEKELQALTQADAAIRQLQTDLDHARHAAAPGLEQLQALETESKEREAALEEAVRQRESADKALHRDRAVADAWQAHLNCLIQDKRIADLQSAQKKIATLEAEQTKLRERIAPLEAFTGKALSRLRKKADAARQANTRLDAYALNLELIATDQAVLLDGTAVKAGEHRTLTHPAELQIGKSTRLRLSPGGAEDLRQAQDAAQAAEAAFQEALRELTVASLEAAEEKYHELESLQRDLTSVQAKLEESDADRIDDDLGEALEAAARHRARRDAILVDHTPISFPDDRKTAEQALRQAEDASQKAGTVRESAASAEKAIRKAASKANTDLDKARQAHQTQLDTIRDLEIRLKVALEKSGDTTSRSQAINHQKAQFDQATQAEREEAEALGKLGADQLELDRERLEKSLKQDEQNLATARDRKIEAQTELKSSGSRDPENEAKEAAAEVRQREKRHADLLNQAEVRHYLLDRLKAARQATTAALARPLEEAVSPYLQLLFGGSQARLHWTEDGSRLESFEIDRTAASNGLHAFDQLSHGTREQVALALRLALAEILAADHDNCLPVILDDAFTHADQHRREKLKSLLYRASQNGLQICLLTCHPENYSGLGAKEIAL